MNSFFDLNIQLCSAISEKEMEELFDRLWPICRSISGDGLRESFKILQEIIPLELKEYNTGTQVYDWEIPKEWNIKDAYIITPTGEKICDFKLNNLHIVNYSMPFIGDVTWEELEVHLHTLKDNPTAIPYITSYYNENWGFCIDFNSYQKLSREGLYKVVVDTELKKGSVSVGSLFLPGESEEEILLSTYLCHPSMANNELSGPITMAYLYQLLSKVENRKYSYRFIMAPETIGVIAYLSDHGSHMKNKTKAGYVLTCCGDDAPFVFKKSKNEMGWLEKVTKHVLEHQSNKFEIIPFSVGGSDERQYCSPGFNLPVGSITRSMYHRYKEYHTSLDNKQFISFQAMKNTIILYFKMIQAMEINIFPICEIQFGEPRLGKRGLLPHSIEPNDKRRKEIDRMFHLITWADGYHDLIDIAEMRNESILDYIEILMKLLNQKIISKK